jgi:hypothetical protein
MLIERVGADLLGNFAAIMNLFDQWVSQFPLQQAVLLVLVDRI